MPRGKRVAQTPKPRQAESYKHPESESPMRPDVGTQAQFKKKNLRLRIGTTRRSRPRSIRTGRMAPAEGRVSKCQKFAQTGQGCRGEHGWYSPGERAALFCHNREFDARERRRQKKAFSRREIKENRASCLKHRGGVSWCINGKASRC